MPRVRAILIALISVALAGLSMSGSGLAAGSYQCDAAGGNAGIVNACGARWEAANIRAHISRGDFSPSRASCLASAADRLDALAAQWAGSRTYTRYTGSWPCGTRPAIGDDGALAAVCPEAIWSYANRGVTSCRPRIARSTTVTRPPEPVQNVQPAPQVPQAYVPQVSSPVSGSCTAGDPAAPQPRGGGTTTLRVAVLPIEQGAEVAVAVQLGIMARAGLDVQISTISSGPAAAAAVASGALDIAATPISTIAMAVSRGVQLVAVAPGAIFSSAALMAGNSSVRSPRDLSGKTIAVSSLNNVTTFATRAMVDASGGDSASLKFIEIPLPAMAPALQAGRVDAAPIEMPFLTSARSSGLRDLGNPYLSLGPCVVNSVWFATSSFASAHADAMHRFRWAMEETARTAAQNYSDVRYIIADTTKISETYLPGPTIYAQGMSPSKMQPILDAASRYGGLSQRMSASQLIFP